MSAAIFNLLPNLQTFHHDIHYQDLLLNQRWVLVNGLSIKKTIYVFKNENILHILEHKTTTKTSWCIKSEHAIAIVTQDGETTVKAYFKDNDILILNKLQTEDCAIFINESSYIKNLNSLEDVQQFLHNKYKNKASTLIFEHEFYYIENSEEFGPFTVKVLKNKVKNKAISAYCFVRDINEHNYNSRLRIKDLIKEL